MDGHILGFSNCYMLLFLRLQASVPEESVAVFLEPNEPLVKATDLLLSVFIHGVWVKTPSTALLVLSITRSD